MAKRQFEIRVHWDEEAQRYWADSDDVPGFVTEAASFEQVLQNVRDLVPELLLLNNIVPAGTEFPVHIVAERKERLRHAG